jgi:hypothetical protein
MVVRCREKKKNQNEPKRKNSELPKKKFQEKTMLRRKKNY